MSQRTENIEDAVILILDSVLTIMKNWKKLRKVLKKKITKSKIKTT